MIAAIESVAVWGDDQHLSGHVHPTGIVKRADGAIHFEENMKVDGLLTHGPNYFKAPVKAEGGIGQRARYRTTTSSTLVLSTLDLFVGIKNPSNYGVTATLADPAEEGRDTGGQAVVVQYTSGGPSTLNIEPTHIEDAGEAVSGVNLEVGQLVWLIWCDGGWRIIQTNGIIY